MPPQQPDRLLDLFNEAFDFSAHGFLRSAAHAAIEMCRGCSGGRRKAQCRRAFRCEPVRVKKTRQNNKLEPRFDLIETEKI
jgi:hypothetical protein